MSELINPEVARLKQNVQEAVKDLHDFTIQIGHKEMAATISHLRNRINEPFMFVIVGEVKVGKSSFTNALLGSKEEICKVAPEPCTDTIQQVLYDTYAHEEKVNPYLKKIYLPAEILREIAIVDTPGTNTIIDYHQEITEGFIPASDLIVFVFEAKNPYRQSAWDFFNFINDEWKRKIIFVLQQKDLIDEKSLKINIEGVRKNALSKGVENPIIFAVSAKEEQENNPDSGFDSVFKYINGHITGGKAPLLKLENNIATLDNIKERLRGGIKDRESQFEYDQKFRKDINHTLETQEEKSIQRVHSLIDNITLAYDNVTQKAHKSLDNGLSFWSLFKRSITSIFKKDASPTAWINELSQSLENDLSLNLKEKISTGVFDIADSIHQMISIIDLKIKNSQTILQNDHEIFSAIAEKRSLIIEELKKTFSDFMKDSENFSNEKLIQSSDTLAPNLKTGSGLAVIGVILATITKGAVFDVTGGILTTIGLLFAGISTNVKKKKIISEYEAEINKGRIALKKNVEEKLLVYIKDIKQKIDANFHDFDHLITKETEELVDLKAKFEDIQSRLSEYRQTIIQIKEKI